MFSSARYFAKMRAYKLALGLLAAVKAKGVALQGVDQLRAEIKLYQGDRHEAREILREELRLFPDNAVAATLFAELGPEDPRIAELDACPIEGAELFKTLLPFTMLSVPRLRALLHGAKLVCEKGAPGHFVECGVSAGGSAALLAWAIKQYSQEARFVYCFDTFEGMPAPGVEDTHAGKPAQETSWGQGTCAAPLDSLLRIARSLDVDDVIRPVRGLFQETLPAMKSKIGPIALLHLDGDWYDSTRAILDNLYDQTVVDGYVQVDDFGYWEGCQKAIREFEKEIGVSFDIHAIDHTGIWFNKPAGGLLPWIMTTYPAVVSDVYSFLFWSV